MNVLDPLDASNMYRDMHRASTIVCAFASALVSRDPSREPPNRNMARTLEEFVAYKAAYGLIRGAGEVSELFDEFEDWRTGVHCSGPADPRALPLHVFDPGAKALDLSREGDARRFAQRFGRSSRRQDDSGRIWQSGVAHGQEALRVSGLELPAGTHWDVSVWRDSTRVANAREVWKVARGSYVNVYPDEHIRKPVARRGRAARRVWDAGTKNAPHRNKGH
jgi:hypothetical protein